MSTVPPDEELRPDSSEAPPDPPPDKDLMPRWVPIVIGVVLVTLAGLAVLTGLRYRENTLVGIIKPRFDARRTAPAPPGEPEPGASRVFSGAEGANVPSANEPLGAEEPRAEITGGPGGVSAVVRIWARRGMQFVAEPADAVVYVNDVPVGHAREYAGGGEEVYDFPEAGSYNVRLDAPGYKPRHFVVTASNNAPQDIAHIKATLEKE